MFAQNLKKYRNQKGLTQKALAELVSQEIQDSFTTSSVSNYENSTSEPDLKKLVSISKILEVSVDQLLGISQGLRPNFMGNDRGNNWGNSESLVSEAQGGYGSPMIYMVSDANLRQYDGDSLDGQNLGRISIPRFSNPDRFRAFEIPDNSLLREDESGLSRHDIIICERVEIPEPRINAILTEFNGLLIGRTTIQGNRVLINPDNTTGNYPSWSVEKSDIIEAWSFRMLLTTAEAATRTKSSRLDSLESTMNAILRKMS